MKFLVFVTFVVHGLNPANLFTKHLTLVKENVTSMLLVCYFNRVRNMSYKNRLKLLYSCRLGILNHEYNESVPISLNHFQV